MENNQKSHSFIPPGCPCYGESNYTRLREMNFHYLSWGKNKNPTIVMLHGFLDHAHTFDLLASYLMDSFNIIAWDARGFGSTDRVHPSGYYHFIEYLYDLDLFLENLNIKNPVLLGHSMGGMIASLYTGVFPEKIAKLINMEGWMIPDSTFSDAPIRARRWIDDVNAGNKFKPLSSLEEATQRLQKNDPLMPYDVAHHLAYEGTKVENDGLYWRHDPLHRTRSPQPAYIEQLEAYWNRIECPTLLLKGEKTVTPLIDCERRINAFKKHKFIEIKEAGHNLHLHQPEEIGKLIRDFLGN
jgi:pimeloyl-ACP methyl ester carboxylesterase